MAELFENFLDWCSKHRAAATYEFLRYRLQKFLDALDAPAAMPMTALKPFHLVECIDAHAAWSDTFRNNLIATIQRPFNWAVKLGYIPENPLRGVEKPAVARHEQVITLAAWATIRDRYPDGDAFRDLLEFAWETGCRPKEVKRIEAATSRAVLRST